jgi:hypothetical protein
MTSILPFHSACACIAFSLIDMFKPPSYLYKYFFASIGIVN